MKIYYYILVAKKSSSASKLAFILALAGVSMRPPFDHSCSVYKAEAGNHEQARQDEETQVHMCAKMRE
jgi:hypothetical protein